MFRITKEKERKEKEMLENKNSKNDNKSDNSIIQNEINKQNVPSTNNDLESDPQSMDKKSSALFYDPFHARRARDMDSVSRVSVLWSLGATCTAVAVFSNTLGSPLYLTAVTLLAEGEIFFSSIRL